MGCGNPPGYRRTGPLSAAQHASGSFTTSRRRKISCTLGHSVPEVFAEIEAAFNRRGILVFPEQPLTDEQQLAFSRLLGPLEVNPNYAGAKMRLRPDVADISADISIEGICGGAAG